MNISPVNQQSFKGIVKVNAPIKYAQQLKEDLGEFKNDKELSVLRRLLDAQDGSEVYAIEVANQDGSYLFGGKQAREFEEQYDDMLNGFMQAGSYYGAGDLYDNATEELMERYRDNVMGILANNEPKASVNINCDGKNKLSVNIIA